jgi:hypothetical protein
VSDAPQEEASEGNVDYCLGASDTLFVVVHRRRYRVIHPKVRSTTQRRGRTSKPWATSERLMISTVKSREAALSMSLARS